MSPSLADRLQAVKSAPLDAMPGGLTPEVPEVPAERRSRAKAPKVAPAPVEPVKAPTARVRATFHLDAEVIEQARDAVLALAGPPEYLTMADLCESALRAEIERLEKKYNKGKRFPNRGDRGVRVGRPVKR